MPRTSFNLLAEPLITVRMRDGVRRPSTLPDILELLGGDVLSDFPALRPHQQHAWHAFLVQLAAIALHRSKLTEPFQTAARWKEMLLDLTDGAEEPWCLVVEDLSKPAFMQPPVPEGKLTTGKGKDWTTTKCADGLDVLVTSKNHDVKGQRAARSTSEQWLMALLTLQTMQGFSGRDNYGIARMNSGFGNRPCVALAPSLDWSQRFRRDAQVLRFVRDEVVSTYEYKLVEGLKLLWLEPWNGTRSISPRSCDPWFVEICRRVRLQFVEGQIIARGISTEVARLSDESEARGQTGDPWTPIEKSGPKAPKALTIPSSGFDYNRLQEVLFGPDIQRSPAQIPQPNDPEDMFLLASAMARGQGKTEGLHQRILPIPGRVRLMLSSVDERTYLSTQARARVAIADSIRRKVLHPALCALLQAGADKLDYRDRADTRWLSAMDDAVDEVFFEQLWVHLEMDPGEAQKLWSRDVIELARAQLEEAISSAPVPMSRRYRAVAAAERMFESLSRKHFPDVYVKGDKDDESRDEPDFAARAG